MTAGPRRVWLVRALWAAGALIVLAAVLHTPPVRRAVLRRALAEVEQRFGLALSASQLRYNLFALRVTLDDVTAAAVDSREEPFLAADQVQVALPRSALFGAFALRLVRMENARITILRRADGTMNVPEGADPGRAEEPAALPIDRAVIPQLSFSYVDVANGVSVVLPALAVDVGAGDGTVRLAAPGRVQRGDIVTSIDRLEGGVTFDGREVDLSALELATREADVVLDGTLALLVSEPHVKLRYEGKVDAGAVARWATASPPSGTFAFEGFVEGPFGAPSAIVRLRDGALAVDGVMFSDLNASVTVNEERLAVSEMDAAFSGGRITVAGELRFDSGEADITGSWAGLDVGALVRTVAPGVRVVPAARATGKGSFRGVPADLAAWVLDASTRLDAEPASRGRMPVSGDARLLVDRGEWQLASAARLAATPVDTQLRGRIDTARVADSTVGGTISIRQSRIPQLARSLRAAGVADVPPDLEIDGLLGVDARLAGSLSNPTLQVRGQARDVAAAGLAGLSADLTAEGTTDRLAFEARIDQGAANAVAATGTLFPLQARLNARIDGRLGDLTQLARGLPLGGIVTLRADVAGPLDALTARGTAVVEDASYDAYRLGPLDATFALDPGSALVSAKAGELGASISAAFALEGTRTAAIDATVENAAIERLVRDAEVPVALSGTLSLAAHAEGALDAWRQGTANVAVTRLEAMAGELPIALRAPARLGFADGTAVVDDIHLAVGETDLSIVGRLPVFGNRPPVAAADALRATLIGDVAQALSAVRATGLVDVPDVRVSGPLALLARVTGSAERPVLAGDLELGPGRLALPVTGSRGSEEQAGGSTEQSPPYEIRSLRVRAHVENGWLDLVDFSGQFQGSQFSAEGRAPLGLFDDYLPQQLVDATAAAAGEAFATARATSIGPGVLAPFVSAEALAQIGGSIDVSARFTADALTLDALQGEVRLDTLDVRLADLPIAQREPTRITVDDGFARVAAWDWTGQGATLGVQGQVRLSDRDAVIRAAGRVDLRTLTPFVRDAGLTVAGTLTPLVAITGPLDNPSINAEVALADAGLRLADPRIVAAGLAAKAVVTSSGAQIAGLTGTVNGGTLTGGGQITFGRGRPASAALDFDIAGMALEFPEGLRSELDADLALALSVPDEGARGTLSGTVTVLRSAYREPIAVLTGLLAALRRERLTATIDEAESLADRVALDVRVVTDTDVVVDNNLARLQLGGDLRVIGTTAAPALSGRAELREGGELFLGRNRYSIDSGTIDFRNPDTIEPNLNIEARTRAGGVEIELTLTGTPEAPSVELDAPDSAEELSQADLASLLLTGRDLQSVSGAEAEIVGEQVLSYLSGDLLGAAGRVVGLDTFRLGGVEETLRRDPSAIATETDPTSRVTFGKAIGDALEITLSQSLRDADAQTWILDYRAIRQLGLRFVSDDEYLRSYEFRHEVSFGPTIERAPEAARPRPTPGPVGTVVLAGNPGPLEERLRAELRLAPGDTFDFAEWQDDRDRLEAVLHEAGYLEGRVTASREEDGAGGVALSYEVEPGSATEIVTAGYDLPRQALDAIRRAWSESVFDEFLEEEAAAIARQALADAGYLEPVVNAGLSAAADPQDLAREGMKTLTIVIEPGPRTLDRDLVIVTADEDLRARIDEWVRDRQLTEAAWREPASVEEAIVSYLEGLGYLRAGASTAAPSLERGLTVLRITVDPGPAFTIGDVRFAGAGSVDTAVLLAAADLAAGSPYVAEAITDARARVLRSYREAGFADARVAVEQAIDPAAARVNIAFTIEEGPRQILREIVVTGNRSIDTDVITRALDLSVGEPLGADTWLQARSRLFDTALFRRVDVTTVPLDDGPPVGGERPVRVLATVQEWPEFRLRYGFQVSEERPEGEVEGRDLVPGFSADLTRRTLFGRAITTGAAVEYQRRDQGARLFASARTMFGLPVESVVTAHRERQEFVATTLLTDRTGASWEQGVRVGSALRVSYSYAYDRDHTFETDPDPDDIFPDFDVTANVARFTAAAVYDTRDDPLDSTRGMQLSSSFDYSTDTIGSDVSFVKELAQAYYFKPWRQVVFASAARVGLALGLDGQTLIPSERFFAGGARTVRGVREQGLGPRTFDGEAAGGGALLVFNQEGRFPIYRWFRGVAFVDAGNVFARPSELKLGDLVLSGGFGLRVTTPFALLRVDYGRVWNEPERSSGRWTFGIGQAF